jgi:hypothetical protein
MEENCVSIIIGTNSIFAWSDCGKSRKTSLRITCLRAGIWSRDLEQESEIVTASSCRITNFRVELLCFIYAGLPICGDYVLCICFVYEYVYLFSCLRHSPSLSLLLNVDLPHQFEIHSTILLKSCKRGLCCSLTSISNKTNMASVRSFSSVTVAKVACEFKFNETRRQPVYLFAQPDFII